MLSFYLMAEVALIGPPFALIADLLKLTAEAFAGSLVFSLDEMLLMPNELCVIWGFPI